MRSQHIALALVGFLATFTLSDATTFKYNNDLTCNSPATIKVKAAGCVGSEYCSLGDKLSAYGTVTFSEDLPTKSLLLTTKACFNGVSWICRSTTDKIDICTDLQLEGTSGETCPEAGTYKFDTDFTIPTLGNINLGSGWWIGSTFTFTDDEGDSGFEFSCKASLKTVSGDSTSSSSSSSAYFVGGALLGVSSLVAIYFVRKRRVATINLSQEEKLVQEGDFEMMNDSVRV